MLNCKVYSYGTDCLCVLNLWKPPRKGQESGGGLITWLFAEALEEVDGAAGGYSADVRRH
jgi:hypothetical protein